MHRDELDLLKPTYKAVPLCVFKDSKFVEPTKVNDMLRNAEAEIQFTIHHLHLGSQRPPRDSFRANIEQIVILNEGKPPPGSALGRPDRRSGPITASTSQLKRTAPADDDHSHKKSKTVDDITSNADAEKNQGWKGKEKESAS